MSRVQLVIPILPVADPPAVEAVARIQPRAVSGTFARWRLAVLLTTQGVFYGLPWLNWHGRQAVLFDLTGQRFYIFDTVLFPQDLILLTGLLIFSALLLFFATALFGRVWCGFACPQTVYTELFQRIEHRLEGNRLARLRLDASPWNARKLLRRGGKHLAWAAVAIPTGFSLVAWFTPARSLASAIPVLALGPWETFWILFYGTATYLHAGVLREKVCQHACPYGRFQGSMLDPATRVISYDAVRGEPRGARARGEDAVSRGQGDCVDCTLCVQVCPVGIDIRRGLQATCISCGLCIDACDTVMDKLKAPRGLIRFQALDRSAGESTWRRPRVIAYAALLLAVAAGLAWGWRARPDLRLNVLRDRGVMSRQGEDGAIENVYRLQLMNTTLQARQLIVRAALDGPDGAPLEVQQNHALGVEPAGTATAVLTIRMAPALVHGGATRRAVPIWIGVQDPSSGGSITASSASTFLLP